MRLELVCLSILVYVPSILCHGRTGSAQTAGVPKSAREAGTEFEDLPAGWSVVKAVEMPAVQVDALAQRWEADLTGIENTFLGFGKESIQINTIRCADFKAASTAFDRLRQNKPNKRTVVRNGRSVFEFVVRSGRSMELAIRARDELGIQPREMTYSVRFKAIPIQDADWGLFNETCSLLMRSSPDSILVDSISRSFVPGRRLALRPVGQGQHDSVWTAKKLESIGKFDTFRVTGIVTSTLNGKTKADPVHPQQVDGAVPPAFSKTAVWPIDDPKIQQAVTGVVGSATSRKQKVKAIQHWMLSSAGVRFGGTAVGTRNGVLATLENGYGRCWDLSDVFITFCRTANVPARQVYGWLAGDQGHVWAEVLIDGAWIPIDPATLNPCGSDYVPLAHSEMGKPPFLYASKVEIEVR